MNRIVIVSFDVTNTLIKFRYAPSTSYRRIAQLYGVDINEKDAERAFKSNFKHLWEKYPNFGYNSIGNRQFWSLIVSNTFNKSGLKANNRNKQLLDKIFEHIYESFSTDECLVCNELTIPLLEQLKSENLKLMTLSNTDERLRSILSFFKINHYFDIVVASYEVGFVKPDKKIFDFALSRIDPEKGLTGKSVVHIGDNLDLDYTGARNAGWNALWLNEDSKAGNVPQGFVLKSLCEAHQRIQWLSSSLIFGGL